VRPDGYRLVWMPEHPDSHTGRVYEHRLVAEEMLGRRLTRDDIVHHKNGDPGDNRPENLEVVSKLWHQRHHAYGVSGRYSDEEIKELMLAGVRGRELRKLVPSTYRTVRLRRELREEGRL